MPLGPMREGSTVGVAMKQRRFGATKRDVAIIGQGTWYLEQADRADAVATLRRGLDLGMAHIDTAEMYGSGVVEEIVGKAIAGRRDEVFLVSKVLPEHASRTGTIRACEQSLERLGTDRLDVYLLHWRGRHPLEATFEAFEQLQRDGKILAWGVSNFDVSDLDASWAVARPRHLACNQVLYHPKERAIEHAVIPWCAEHSVAVVAYSPFGSGDFPGPRTSGGRVLQAIATAHDATPRQVALAFLLRWPSVFVIPKASTPDHAEENAGAAELELSTAELARLEKAFPLGRRRDLPML